MTDTPPEREDEDSTWSQAAPPQGGAVGHCLCRRCLGSAAGAAVPGRDLRLAEAGASDSRRSHSLIGLPIVLVLAWYHGDRGHQKPVRTELAIIALLLLIGGAGLWLYQRSTEHVAKPGATPAATPQRRAPPPRKTTASVAVLPFANLSADPANEYLADGIAETMITMLAQVPQLLVIGKNSSFSYKGKDVDSRTIGQQLGVGALLEGSVQRAGDRLRVAVQLVSTARRRPPLGRDLRSPDRRTCSPCRTTSRSV